MQLIVLLISGQYLRNVLLDRYLYLGTYGQV